MRRNPYGPVRKRAPGPPASAAAIRSAWRVEQLELRARHRLQPLLRRRARAERRRAADDRLLERDVLLLEQRLGEPGAVAEAAEERALADAGLGRDRVHRDVLDAVAGEQPLGRGEHLGAVALRVGALARLGVDDRQLDHRSATAARHRRCGPCRSRPILAVGASPRPVAAGRRSGTRYRAIEVVRGGGARGIARRSASVAVARRTEADVMQRLLVPWKSRRPTPSPTVGACRSARERKVWQLANVASRRLAARRTSRGASQRASAALRRARCRRARAARVPAAGDSAGPAGPRGPRWPRGPRGPARASLARTAAASFGSPIEPALELRAADAPRLSSLPSISFAASDGTLERDQQRERRDQRCAGWSSCLRTTASWWTAGRALTLSGRRSGCLCSGGDRARRPPRARRRAGRRGSARGRRGGAGCAAARRRAAPPRASMQPPMIAARWNVSTPASLHRRARRPRGRPPAARRGRPGASARSRASATCSCAAGVSAAAAELACRAGRRRRRRAPRRPRPSRAARPCARSRC